MKIQIPYSPRKWQAEVDKKSKRFHTLVVHRRAGKTVYATNKLAQKCLTTKKHRPQVAYIAPTYKQAKKVAWEMLKSNLKEFISNKLATTNEAELRINFCKELGGGVIMVLGAENADSLRGLYFDYVVLDEVADMKREVWTKVIRPALADRKGGALFIGTPKGKNYFYELYMKGVDTINDQYGSDLLTYRDTNALDEEEIAEIRKEITEEEFLQEFECSFTAAIRGAYFGKNLDTAEREGRIGNFKYDRERPVIAAWDIGFDGTAVWFAQITNNEINIIDFLQVYDMDVPEVVQLVKNKPYIYDYQIVPHDAAKRSSLDKTVTIKSSIEKLGLKCITAPRTADLNNDINNSRRLLDKCTFNLYNVQKGLDLLRLYRSKYDEANGVFLSTPIHDDSSHAADAFRTLASGLKKRNYSRKNTPVAIRGNYDPLAVNHNHIRVINNDWDPLNLRLQ